MKKLIIYSPYLIAIFFAFLFSYAALSKAMDFNNFQVQLAQSPLLSAHAGFISYGIIILELVTVGLLCFHPTRLIGLYVSFSLMVAFTVYIYLILHYSDFVPCSCGGILERMTWKQHMVFNMGSVILAFTGIIFIGKERAYRWSRTAAGLAFTAVLSAGSMVALFLSSEYIMKKENNFTRRFLPHPIDLPKKLNLEVNSFYFAGQYGDTIFLGNRSAPLIIGKVYPSFDKLILDTLRISDTSLPFQELKLQVHYPYFSLADGHVPAVFEGEFPNVNARPAMLTKAYFSRIVMIKPQHYIFRGQSTKTGETIMGLLETGNDVKFRFNTTFLEKQIDGIFDTDGTFVTDPVKQNVIYTYFYRNEYRVLDDQLRFNGRGKTIDTITKAQLNLTTLKDGRIKMNAPPMKVNQDQAAYSGLLFNEANLRGRHESAKMWQQAKIVDVYHYPTSTYRYSFYVHHDGTDKMRSMLVTAKHFYILSGRKLIRYQRMR